MFSKKTAQEMYSLAFSMGRILREQSMRLTNRPIHSFPSAYIETACFIAAHEAVTMKELAGYLHIKPPSATAIVDQMLRAKLIQRFHSGTDRRTVLLKITTFGKRIMRERVAIADQIMKKTFSVLNKNEQKIFIKLLKKIVTNV